LAVIALCSRHPRRQQQEGHARDNRPCHGMRPSDWVSCALTPKGEIRRVKRLLFASSDVPFTELTGARRKTRTTYFGSLDQRIFLRLSFSKTWGGGSMICEG
jgi:hypothetical protein